jgi:hypothetical protein
MDSKELRGLYEAYNEVYAPQENIEEGLRSAVKRLLGGGKKETEAPKPESRGDQLRKKYNVGPEKSDTSAKRQILDRSRARAEKDEKDYGDSKYSKSVAQKSKAAHDKYLKAGYSKYGADDARGSGSKARKRAAALNREEFAYDAFDVVLEYLVVEGYADTNESALVIMANMSEEWREEILDEAYVDFQKGSLTIPSRVQGNRKTESPYDRANRSQFKKMADAQTTRGTQAVRGPRGKKARLAAKQGEVIQQVTQKYHNK